MKKSILLFVLLLTAVITAGAFAEEAYFTCDSDPADFNGKTFDNLHIMIDGCTNFNSTVIPGEEVFVTLKDIKANFLSFGDAKFDQASGNWIVDENGTGYHPNVYLNISGDSHVNRIDYGCEYNHECSLGIQFPARIEQLDLCAWSKKGLGKMIVRGYVDPLVDEKTDYYSDTVVASYPDFNISTFDLDFTKPALEDPQAFAQSNLAAVEYGKNMPHPYGLYAFFNDSSFSEGIRNMYKRAHVDFLRIRNAFGTEIGDFDVDLANIEIGYATIYTCDFPEYGQPEYYSTHDWIPNINSRGFVTIGALASGISFKTNVYAPAPYSVTSDDPEKMVLPMYIDLLLLGGTDKVVQYDMDHTRAAMLNYLGNESPESKLDLNIGSLGNYINMPRIGIANIIGGKFDMSCEQSKQDVPSIEKLNFYEGLDNFYYDDRSTDYALYTPYYSDYDNTILYNVDPATGKENQSTAALREKRTNLYIENILTQDNIAKTSEGYFLITASLDGLIKPGNVDMSGKSVVTFYGQNLSLGDIAVSKNLGEITNWMDGNCNFWQHGTTQMIVRTIN